MVLHQIFGNFEEIIRKECELLSASCEAITRLEWALARGVGGLNAAETSLVEEDLVWGQKILNDARKKTHQLKDIISPVSFNPFWSGGLGPGNIHIYLE